MPIVEMSEEDKALVKANLTTGKVVTYQKEQLEKRFIELGITRIDVAKSKGDYDSEKDKETKVP